MMMKVVRHLENRKQLAEEVNNLRHYKTIRYDAGQSMYKVKLILRWIQLRYLFRTLVMLMIFFPISILITIYYNTKIDQAIPEGLYLAVAQVLAYVFQLQEFRNGKASKPSKVSDLEIPDELKR